MMNLSPKDAVIGTAVAGAFIGVIVFTQHKYNKLEARVLELEEEMKTLAKYVRLLESKTALEFRAMGRQVGNFNEQQPGQSSTQDNDGNASAPQGPQEPEESQPPVVSQPPNRNQPTHQHATSTHHGHQHSNHHGHSHSHQGHQHHNHPHHQQQAQEEEEEEPEEEEDEPEQPPQRSPPREQQKEQPKQTRNIRHQYEQRGRPSEPVQMQPKQDSNRRPISARSATMNARAVRVSTGRRHNVANTNNSSTAEPKRSIPQEQKQTPQAVPPSPPQSNRSPSPPQTNHPDPNTSKSKRRFKPQNEDDAEDVKVSSKNSAKGNISGIGGPSKEPKPENGRNKVEKGKHEADDDLLGDIEAVAAISKRRPEVKDDTSGSGMTHQKQKMARTMQIAAMMQKRREEQAKALQSQTK